MAKIIGLYYECYNFSENYITFVEFQDKVNKQEVESYIMELKQKLPCWDTETITKEIEKKYKIKKVFTLCGDEFIGI